MRSLVPIAQTSAMDGAQVGWAGLFMLGLQQPLSAEQVKQIAHAAHLMVDLGTRRTRTKMATTSVFHKYLLEIGRGGAGPNLR
jgi:hypothetical protein